MSLTAVTNVGRDRWLTIDETDGDVAGVWDTYSVQFDGFTGATLDPQFARLDHPAETFGRPLVAPGTTIVIAGTGPSLAAEAGTLARIRGHLSVWTSLRGAEALATFGVRPDLILVQHASDLDAYLTARHLADRRHANPLSSAPVVLAEPRAPASLLADLPADRVTAIDPAIGWGLWPAALASLAVTSGASTVALLGVDLGAPGALDPAHAPLAALLGNIAGRAGRIATLDLGDGAVKAGWSPAMTSAVAAGSIAPPVTVSPHPWVSRAERHESLARALDMLSDPLQSAQEYRRMATAARDGGTRRSADAALRSGWESLLSWRSDVPMRIAIQEELGARFLPRFWRQAPDTITGPIWRPVLLAAEELLLQAERAKARCAHNHPWTAA